MVRKKSLADLNFRMAVAGSHENISITISSGNISNISMTESRKKKRDLLFFDKSSSDIDFHLISFPYGSCVVIHSLFRSFQEFKSSKLGRSTSFIFGRVSTSSLHYGVSVSSSLMVSEGELYLDIMSSRYPILDNRPIDQWKVTELKEELKRRKLTTKGLKDDLIKRLNEAICIEREAAEASEKDEADKASKEDEANKASKEDEANKASKKDEANKASKKDEANGLDSDPQPVAGVQGSETVTVVSEVVDTISRGSPKPVETAAAEKGNIDTVKQVERENVEKVSVVVGDESTNSDKPDVVTVPVDVNNCVTPLAEGVGHTDLPASVDSASVAKELVVHGSTVETRIKVSESVTKVVVSCQDSYSKEILENEELATQLETEHSKPQTEFGLKTDLMPDCSISENQVSEVNPRLGSQVKSDSISSDSVSINEKNELKDNIIAYDVKLEHNIIKPEMVEPSPRSFVPVYDESRSMDDRELHEKKASVEENINITSPDLKKTNSSEDVGYPEKLNLDRSSGDDSMEEDLPESKQFDSKFNEDELGEKSKSTEVPILKEESGTKVVGGVLSEAKSDVHQDNDISPIMSTEKRKFHDQVSVGNNEPAKRQRRWNSETIKGPDPQSTTPATTPKNESIALKRNFSRSDSSASDDAPRIVPPSQRSPTTSLRIDRFLRPFTLKQVQELLGKTGKVNSFWMDHIKTHCYVTYSSVEEATETRNAVYNLQWPPNGGRHLIAEYVDPQEVKMKLETPPVPAASVSSSPTVPPAPPTSRPEPSPRQPREQPPVPISLPPPPPLSKLPPALRERLPSPPPLPEKSDPPIVTLDDLFRKTRATPRIYYLPLSEEQVAAKLAAQGKSTRHQALGMH
ncbi:Apoptotic chromatin condensation inducer in the nucleus [Senna tora]|uniref:Apoptotic chromatin condensation inducer in the nucleus n=1 Tax=Senna tora TaxID=362788 RepID=A0A834WXE5_9FABA|nr:Apoptotic chromatin condensation inducer in the nucleus [Senna tora]